MALQALFMVKLPRVGFTGMIVGGTEHVGVFECLEGDSTIYQVYGDDELSTAPVGRKAELSHVKDDVVARVGIVAIGPVVILVHTVELDPVPDKRYIESAWHRRRANRISRSHASQ